MLPFGSSEGPPTTFVSAEFAPLFRESVPEIVSPSLLKVGIQPSTFSWKDAIEVD
jgi:hypothetical protein